MIHDVLKMKMMFRLGKNYNDQTAVFFTPKNGGVVCGFSPSPEKFRFKNYTPPLPR